jgi:F-type H+-transporting ATPase subunit alpha
MGKLADGDWDDDIEEQLGKAIAEAIDDFGPDFDAEGNPLEEGESDRVKSEQEGEDGGDEAAESSDDDAAEGEAESEDGEQGEKKKDREKEEAASA